MRPIVSRKIRQAARGEDCTMQVVGVCNHNPETVIFAHLPFDGGAMGGKASDLSGAFACDRCHSVADRREWSDELEEHREFYFRRATLRTLHRLVELGIITIR